MTARMRVDRLSTFLLGLGRKCSWLIRARVVHRSGLLPTRFHCLGNFNDSSRELPPWFLERRNITSRPPGR